MFVDKTTFGFHLFKKVNDFVTNQYITAMFYPFYLNPQSWENENGIQLVNKNCYTTQDGGE